MQSWGEGEWTARDVRSGIGAMLLEIAEAIDEATLSLDQVRRSLGSPEEHASVATLSEGDPAPPDETQAASPPRSAAA
jgi:hypothetical protein